MKLSKRTVQILRNFATINQSIVIRPGNTISTISNVKDLYGTATIDETFDREVAIYDLNELLSMLSLFEDPTLSFGPSALTISEGNMSQRYAYSEASIITTPPANGINLPSVEVTGNLTRDQLAKVIKAAALTSATALRLSNGNVTTYSEGSGNTFELAGVLSHPVDYSLSIAVDKLKMIQDDYEIRVCARGLSSFIGASGVTYSVALMPNGTYGS